MWTLPERTSGPTGAWRPTTRSAGRRTRTWSHSSFMSVCRSLASIGKTQSSLRSSHGYARRRPSAMTRCACTPQRFKVSSSNGASAGSASSTTSLSCCHLRGIDPAARGPSGQGRVLYWYDPMAPNQHFDKPGKSPFMDMQLVPRHANETEQASTVRVSPALVQNLGIRLGKVERVSLPRRLHAVGSVAFDERLLQLVQARVEGYITQLHVKAPLVHVRRGEPLATVL